MWLGLELLAACVAFRFVVGRDWLVLGALDQSPPWIGWLPGFDLALLDLLLLSTALSLGSHLVFAQTAGSRSLLVACRSLSRIFAPLLPLGLLPLLARPELGAWGRCLLGLVIGVGPLLLALPVLVAVAESIRPGGLALLGRLRPWMIWVLAVSLSLVLAHDSLPDISGDEPSYLAVAMSLVHDRDLEISDLEQPNDWESPLQPHLAEASVGEREYSVHGLGVSLLILPAVALGALVGGQVVLSQVLMILIAGLLPALLLALWRELEIEPSLAGASALIAMGLSPFLVYMPRITYHPAVSVLVLWWLLEDLRARRASSARALLATVVVSLALGLLHGKLSLVAVGLIGAGFWRARAAPRAQRVLAATILGIGIVAGLTAMKMMYGAPSPIAMYAGSGAIDASVSASLKGGLLGLFKLLFDQRHGLLLISPVFVLLVPALKRLRQWPSLALGLAMAMVITLANTSHYWYLGWCPPQRGLYLFLSLLVVLLPWALSGLRSGAMRAATTILLALSLVQSVILASSDVLAFGNISRPELGSDLYRLISVPGLIDLVPALPRFRIAWMEELEKAVALGVVGVSFLALAWFLDRVLEERPVLAATGVVLAFLMMLPLPLIFPGSTAAPSLASLEQSRRLSSKALTRLDIGRWAGEEPSSLSGAAAQSTEMVYSLRQSRLGPDELDLLPDEDRPAMRVERVQRLGFLPGGPVRWRVDCEGAAIEVLLAISDEYTGARILGAGSGQGTARGVLSIDRGQHLASLEVEADAPVTCSRLTLQLKLE